MCGISGILRADGEPVSSGLVDVKERWIDYTLR